MRQTPDEVFLEALAGLDLDRGRPPLGLVQLEGGVSSDIWRLDFATGSLCAKRALPKLRVEADWRAPVERNAAEAGWLRWANETIPGAAPRVVAEDRERGLFVMEHLDPRSHRLWKEELLAGKVEAPFARKVGRLVGRLHRESASDSDLARAFSNAATFHDIRIEPYLLHPIEKNPDLADQLREVASGQDTASIALIHGDVSPKNILERPDGEPTLLDAECATFADPAFDLAFCLNHLFLKARVVPQTVADLAACTVALWETYADEVAWEDVSALEARTARLLPGLMLGRIDGRSPVEYLDTEERRIPVRAFARRFLLDPVPSLEMLAQTWQEMPEPFRA